VHASGPGRRPVDGTSPASYFVVDRIRCSTKQPFRPQREEPQPDPMNEVYRALSDPTRRRVLALLRERDMTAGELAANFELSAPTMSGHFAVLKEAGLIQADRTGSTITYRLNVSVLEEAMMALMDAFRLEPRRSPR